MQPAEAITFLSRASQDLREEEEVLEEKESSKKTSQGVRPTHKAPNLSEASDQMVFLIEASRWNPPRVRATDQYGQDLDLQVVYDSPDQASRVDDLISARAHLASANHRVQMTYKAVDGQGLSVSTSITCTATDLVKRFGGRIYTEDEISL